MIEKAIKLLAHYQGKQKDRGGNPYILHPIRIALKLDTQTQRAAALLHDIIEDTNCDEEVLLAEGISQEVIDIIKILTRNENELYEDYIVRIKRSLNDDAIRIKKLDLLDNIDLTRLKKVTDKDLKRNKKYERAYKFLCE